MRPACWAALALLSVTACDKGETEAVPSTAAPPPVATPSAPATAAEAEFDEVETEEDFEEEALHEISGENFEEELDRLEAEIGN